MKKLLILGGIMFLFKMGIACSCYNYEPNFFKNVNSDYSYCYGVVKHKVTFDQMQLVSISAYVEVIDTIGNFPNNPGDQILVTGQDGLNCGESISVFQNGDSVIFGLGGGFYTPFVQDTFYLDGCGANYLKIKNGVSNKLSYSEVKERVYNILAEEHKKQACFNMFNAIGFYENLNMNSHICMAVFNSYDYSYAEGNMIAQTGSFKLIDTIGSFDIDLGYNFTVIGENGLNCGQLLSDFTEGDTLFLSISDEYDNGVKKDTFYLKGGGAGNSYLKITDGMNNGLDISEIKQKIINDISGIELVEIGKGIKVYPNPTYKVLNIESETVDIRSVEAYDINGNLIFDFGNINDTYAEFDISAVAPGIISLNIDTAKGMVSKKVIKE